MARKKAEVALTVNHLGAAQVNTLKEQLADAGNSLVVSIEKALVFQIKAREVTRSKIKKQVVKLDAAKAKLKTLKAKCKLKSTPAKLIQLEKQKTLIHDFKQVIIDLRVESAAIKSEIESLQADKRFCSAREKVCREFEMQWLKKMQKKEKVQGASKAKAKAKTKTKTKAKGKAKIKSPAKKKLEVMVADHAIESDAETL